MPLHPHMVVALTQLDDFEQDALERLCWDDWDRVSYDFKHGHVYVDGRLTTFLLQEPIDDFDPEQYFVKDVIDLDAPRPEITKVTLYEDEAGTKPVGIWRPHILKDGVGPCIECGDRQAVRGARCPKLSSGERPPEEWHLDASRVDEPGIPVVIEVPAGSHADEEEEQRVVAEADGRAHEGVSSDKKCGYVECENGTGGSKYCSVRCQRRQAQYVRKTKGDRAKAPATPVLAEPVGELVPACPKCHVLMIDPPTHECVPPQPRRVWCARCEQEGHYVEDCPLPLSKGGRKKKSTPVDAPVEDASQKSVREAKERLAASKKHAKGEAPEVIHCARCCEKGHSIFTCPKPAPPVTHLVKAPKNEPLTDDELTAHSAALQRLCSDGLPEHFQYSYKDDVLALYGIDTDLMDAALRNPERVEIRPESFEKEKRYCVLAFYRGDLEVILGMRNPGAPMVIAAYANSRLENDTHRVGHTGGGGSKNADRGLPRTSRAVAQRLRSMGAEVEVDLREDHTTVTFKGQDLGKIACNGDRKTCEQDFQRVQRKIAAIERRIVSVG